MVADAPTYNSLPKIEHTTPVSQHELSRLEALLPLFKTDKIYLDVGISLKHRHFQLKNRERIVWNYNNGSITSEVVNDSTKGLLPVVFSITSDGGLTPDEFVNTVGLPDMHRLRIENYSNDHTKLRKITKSLVFLNVTDRFSLSLMPIILSSIHTSGTTKARNENLGFLEISDDETRRSTLSFRKIPDTGNIEALWMFYKGRTIIVASNCTCNSSPPPPPPP